MNTTDPVRLAAQLRDKARLQCIGELLYRGKITEAQIQLDQLEQPDDCDPILRRQVTSHGQPSQPVEHGHLETTSPRSANDADPLFKLAVRYHRTGAMPHAIAAYQTCLEKQPAHAQAWQNLGSALHSLGQFDAAIDACRRAIALDPNNAAVRANLAEILRDSGDLDAAVVEAEQAVSLAPASYQVHMNCAAVHNSRGSIELALHHYHLAAQHVPGDSRPHESMGSIEARRGNYAVAEQHYTYALSLNPKNPDLHFGRALALLSQGKLAEGWHEWEYRVHCAHHETGLLKTFRGPLWQGEPLQGKRILVVTEQGFGDSFMFCRYLSWLKAQSATVLLMCQPGLVEIMKGLDTVDTLIAKPDHAEPELTYDYYIWLMSLPRLHGTTMATIPNRVPYLHADSHRVQVWREHITRYAGLKIGLVWAGNPRNRNDARRSLPFSLLAPLLAVPGTTFFNLQAGNAAQEIHASPGNGKIVDLSTELDHEARFVDTAAVMTLLDLVITVDTSTCHLAGALGRPVWTLLPRACDWRWLEHGDITPWYPTMCLFRQPQQDDWHSVIARVATELTQMVHRTTVTMPQTQVIDPPAQPAVSCAPSRRDPLALCRQAVRLHRKGQTADAIPLYRAAVETDPGHWEAWHLLGLACFQQGDIRRAFKYIHRALHLAPRYADAHCNVALVYESIGKLKEAAHHYQRALEIEPRHFEAHVNLGGLKYKLGELHTALHYFNSALKINSRSSQAYNNIGVIQLGQGDTRRALEHFDQALRIDPNSAEAHNNRGNALKQIGRQHDALHAYNTALEKDPAFAAAHWNRGLIRLSQGDYLPGWEAYEWGHRCGERPHWNLPCAQWDGSPLHGKSILLYPEQGVGDELFFGRYLSRIVPDASRVELYCDPRLIPLFQRAYPTLRCRSSTELKNAGTTPTHTDFDYAIPTGSLAQHFCRSAQQVSAVPAAYLKPDATRVNTWRQRLATLGASLKVGIAWRGGKSPDQQRLRSIPLASWGEALRQREVSFVSLQHGDHADEIAQFAVSTGITLHTWPQSDPLHELDDFAAYLAALDLVISVDNSTVHLAGALGLETWVLIPVAGDFRWQTQGNTTPWYPTMRLIRQSRADDWTSALKELNTMLQSRESATVVRRTTPCVSTRSSSSTAIESPILIVGAPRSGTSLLTGILEHGGAWLGPTLPGDAPNPKGYFENELLRDLNKQVLADLGYDPLGVDPLPQRKPPHLLTFRAAVIRRLQYQGYAEQAPWAFKCVKTPLLWPLWHAAFPRARWIIVRRDASDIVQSCLRSSFFQSRGQNQAWWQQWLDRFESFLAELRSSVNSCREISVARVIDGDMTALQALVTDLGLDWNEAPIRAFIDPTLWRRQDYQRLPSLPTTLPGNEKNPPYSARNIALAAQLERQTYKALLADELDQSDELCRRWFAADPLSDEAYRLLGSSACQRREWQRAIEHFETALEYRPASAQLHYNLGVALFQCGRYNDAVTYYELATTIKADYVEAWENFAASLAAAGQYHRAAEVYRRLLQTTPFRVASRQALTKLERFLATDSYTPS